MLQGFSFPVFKQSIKNFELWFLNHQRALPWRDSPDVYRVWISEIMLQQTQVKTVIPYFEKFIQRFPDVKTLASASEDEVLLHWAGLGYYSRAKNIHRSAQIIAEKGFPTNRKDWLAMPGVGEYTAGAILSIAQNQIEAILDTNVVRVISRLRVIKKHNKKRLWKLSKIMVNYAASLNIAPTVFNQALMELGAIICSPKEPQCKSCPLNKSCKAFKGDYPENYPPPKKPKEWVLIEEECFALLFDKKILVQKQNKGTWRKGLWDIPAKSPFQFEKSLQPLFELQVKYTVTKHKVRRKIKVFQLKDTFKLNNNSEYYWLNLDEKKPPIAYGAALRKVLEKLKKLENSLFHSTRI